MEYRQLGASGLQVPVLSFGTATFAGGNEFFKAWGNTQLDEAKHLVHLCLDAGVNFFDTANVYSHGASEEMLGKTIEGIRDQVIISTKATFPMGDTPNEMGSSRFHLIKQCEASLKRLNTDYIDIYHMHGFDGRTPIEETLRALDDLISAGKIRYIACSNFSGWALMKSLTVSERYGWSRYVAHQVLYNLYDREFEWELMPVGINENVGSLIWSPLSSGRLGGRFKRNNPVPQDNRLSQGGAHGPATDFERLYNIVDSLEEVAGEVNKSIAQVALNWLLQRPTVSNIIIGARNEAQLKENFGAIGWNLTTEQLKRLDNASEQTIAYPYWHQRQNTALNPLPKFY
ncbi:MAG TPA: aldo/keto reductase [Arachidicoccus sp.]